MPLRRLLPLLSCPLCALRRGNSPLPLLRNPFTLHCGHTVCSSHLKSLDPTQRCPLPTCSFTPNLNAARPNIPSSSRVIYQPATPLPPSAQQAAATSTNQFEQRVDVTVSKLIEVVSRHSPPPPASDFRVFDLSDEDDHYARLDRPQIPSSDEETKFRVGRGTRRSSGHRRRRAPGPTSQFTDPHHSESTLQSSNSVGMVSSDSVENALPSSSSWHAADGGISDSDLSPEPPKKRLRCDSRALVTDQQTQSCAIEPVAETGNSDANRPQPNRPGAERSPRVGEGTGGGGEDLRTRVDKELLTELSCEICFAIYYQPVTTPCQHVSLPPPLHSSPELSAICHFHPLPGVYW